MFIHALKTIAFIAL